MLVRGILVIVILATCVTCKLPDLQKVCSALMSDKRTTCDRSTCQGVQGKRGIPGIKGDPGLKGDGVSHEDLKEIKKLRDDVKQLFKMVPVNNKIDYCAMGMKSGKIPDSAISVSSSWSNYNGKYARLDKRSRGSMVYTGWHPRDVDSPNEWIQVDLESPKSVSGLVTQGRSDCHCEQWTTSYKVACGDSPTSLKILTENGKEKIFPANKDKSTKVVNMFPSPVTCRYIRIYPQTWKETSVLRIEFLRGDCSHMFAK